MASLDEYYEQELHWRDCEDGFECTTVQVPVDYAKPTTGSIGLSVVRLPAGKPDERIGSLLVNPGGPGGSGVEYARSAESIVSAGVRERYDIVGFDPRGVASSDPVDCVSDGELDEFLAIDGSPDTPAEEAQLAAASKGLATGCQQHSASLLPFVGTRDAARDMDVLRGVLGDEKLYYLGKSYGTFLGATYAEEYPTHVGRMVLDGAEDPRVPEKQFMIEQAKGFETALSAFVDDCVKRKDCPVGRTRAAALARIDALLAATDQHPLSSDSGREVTQALVVLGVIASLYDETSGWAILRQGLKEALAGDGTTLLLVADFYTDRDENGHFASNRNEVIYAVDCMDKPGREGPEEAASTVPEFKAAAPHFGVYLAWSSLPCAYWPYPATNRPHAIAAEGAPPIVVVGTLRDPATPYEWAVGLAEQLSSGVLLSWDGDGHTAYKRGSKCIDAAVDRYLLQGTPPADGTQCG
jgi:pimeloyl-ACP methyl ester carboxylesterase